MARALSEDLRGRVIAAIEAGLSRRSAAERFGVSASSAIRWMAEYRASGASKPRPQGGDKRSRRMEAYADAILAAVRAKPDMTLVETADWLAAEHDLVVAPSSVWRFFDRHGLTFKKNGASRRAGAS